MRLFAYRRAGAVVLNQDHEVLLISMQPPGGRLWYHFPGGGIEEGETPAEAAARELFEETGLRAQSLQEYLQGGIQGGYHHYFLATCATLDLGAITGPELQYAADHDFHRVWVPVRELGRIPVWPRCVAEHVAQSDAPGVVPSGVPWVEDDRGSWEGIEGETAPSDIGFAVSAVIRSGDRVATVRRHLTGGDYFTLPGGTFAPGERAEDAVVRETYRELGLFVRPLGKVAVVAVARNGSHILHTYFSCEVRDGFSGATTNAGAGSGAGSGAGYSLFGQPAGGDCPPAWWPGSELPARFDPPWLADKLPRWLDDPVPDRPERFCELHDE